MATRKNNWLNAKPVTKAGGKSGGARNPAKPYKKPSAGSKPKPSAKSSKPEVKTKPVTRTGPVKGPVAPKGSTGTVTMPNSARRSYNLPKAANSITTPKSGPSLRGTTPGSRNTTPAKPAPKASVKPPSTLRRAGGSLVAGTILTTAAGKVLETFGKAAQPSEWKRVQKELKDRGYGGRNKPVQADPNGRSSTGIRVSDKANKRDYNAAPTGSQQYNDYRNKEIAANRERLKGVGNPPAAKPKPPAPARDRGGNNSPAAPRPKSAPAMPKKPFAGSVSEGRKMWAEKYSSSKYDGQAIQKEAKALLKKMKEEKNNQSSAQRAGWDGNKNY